MKYSALFNKTMKYFDNNFSDFFIQLEKNNYKDWFHAHITEYEKFVKIPFENFVNDIIIEVSKHEDLSEVTAKDCILRINRDIRFTKDKSPYNLHVTAFVSQGGRKDKTIPGIFLRFSPKSVGIMGGCYGPSSQQIEKIRKYIFKNVNEFQRIRLAEDFINKFNEIKGDAIKRVPSELKTIAETEALILNKQWYFVAEREIDLLYRDNLLDEIMHYYFAAKPINNFLKQAIG